MSKLTIPPVGTNLSILVGALSRGPVLRVLPSGDEVLSLELTIRPEGGAAESVPAAWTGAPAEAASWAEGEELVVVGRVRRRFFRSGGTTQSRTEVVVATAVPTRRAATAERAVRSALATLTPRL